MKKENKNPLDAFSLRQKAEEKLKKKHSLKSPILTEADTLKLLHELEVHQIELEMQNTELRLARDEAKTASAKYNELYDFALTGYFTLLPNGKICGLNLTGARMLGKDRSSLINSTFKQFVTLDTLSDFNNFFRKVFETNSKGTCEVRLIMAGNPSLFVHIEGIVSEDEQKCQLTVADASKHMRAEELLQQKAREFIQFNEFMTVSDQQMIELKKEINLLLKKLGEKGKFKI